MADRVVRVSTPTIDELMKGCFTSLAQQIVR